MTLRDLLGISLGNLLRRRLRTFLTVLGVFIGTTSIVVMMSLGIGLNQFIMDQFSSETSLTTITVSNYDMDTSKKDAEKSFLTDSVVDGFTSIPHVTDAYPALSCSVLMKQGLYEGYISLVGIPVRAMRAIPLGEGKLPSGKGTGLELVVGNMVPLNFYNPKNTHQEDFWSTGTAPVDFHEPVFTIFDTDAYYAAQNPAEGTERTSPPKKYLLPVSGFVKGTISDYNAYSYNVYCDLEKLEQQLRQIYGKRQIPGQPVNRKGKPYRYFIYSECRVEVDDMDHVEEVQKALQDLGYQADSPMAWVKQSQKTSQMIQAVLGGIGAVSLLVAAIGITNTMMMSIYERTKEIGIMKVLGCDLRDIRRMFLMEAGMIGLMGGAAGLVFSWGISALLNRLLGTSLGDGTMTVRLSIIPLWLAGAALAFAALIGMAAGYFPARRAMMLSPLAAIRNE
jgi:ABC-type antimicrobial peptide transport system permease subunit